MNILVFGTSITQGYWDTEGGWVGRWRKQCDEAQLQDLDKNMSVIFNLGVDGNTTKDIVGRIVSETKARTTGKRLPVVIVQVGTNDSLEENGAPWVSREDYARNLEAIIQLVQPVSSRLVFVGLSACDETKTTPVSWGGFYYSNANIKAYEQTMQTVAAAHNIPFIPLFDRFAEAMRAQSLLSDGLHPNSAGHQVMFEIVLSEITPVLS